MNVLRANSGRADKLSGGEPVGGFTGQSVTKIIGQLRGEIEEIGQRMAVYGRSVMFRDRLGHRRREMPFVKNGGGHFIARPTKGIFFPNDEG